MKGIARCVIALFGAFFGSLLVSVQICSYAARQTQWPRWADFMCGHNVGYQWIISGPILFAVLVAILSTPFSRFRRHWVVLLLAVYGAYGLVLSLSSSQTLSTIYSVMLLVAAVGVALRTAWARYLVYALTIVFVATLAFSIWNAANAGFFQSSGVSRSILSLMPGAAFGLLGLFCCYVVTVPRDSRAIPPTQSSD